MTADPNGAEPAITGPAIAGPEVGRTSSLVPDPDTRGARSAGSRATPGAAFAALAALCAIYGLLAWKFLIPGLAGRYNDDGVYVVTARALARGLGYILPWSPNMLPADRFPIGYPALIAPVFWLPGSTQSHVLIVEILGIGFGALAIVLSYLFAVRRLGVAPWLALSAVGIVGLSPVFLNNAPSAMSDLPFGGAFVGALWLSLRYADRPTRGRLLVAAFATAIAVLIRYIGAILPVVLVLGLLADRRPRDAFKFGVATVLLLCPWLVWVVLNGAFGYGGQFRHMVTNPAMFAVSLAFSFLYSLVQGLPAFLLPSWVIPEYPGRSPFPFGQPLLLVGGAAISILLAAGCAMAARDPRCRVAVWAIGAYAGVVVAWQSGFLNLGELLTTRLLLPVMPLILILALVGWGRRLAMGAPVHRALIGLLILGGLVTAAASISTQNDRVIRVAIPAEELNFRSLVLLLEEFARQVPADRAVATDHEPLFHMVTGRTVYSATANPRAILSLLHSTPVEFLVLTPTLVGTRDLTLEAVRTANKTVPGLILTIESNGTPTGVFRVDRTKLRRPGSN